MPGKFIGICAIAIVMVVNSLMVRAQNEYAATLEVLKSGVEVQRVNTTAFIAVEIEAIVGVGDTIRTDDTGEARITFFADGTDVVLKPNTQYRITEFQGSAEDFQLTVAVLAGQTTHRLNRALGTNSRYDVQTPGMTLAAKGTVFAVRVENTGRSGMLVFDGIVDSAAGSARANVPAEYGIRSEGDNKLSDVVLASTFEQLDAALDGCAASVTTTDDVSINVRLGPSIEQTRVGIIAATDVERFIGVSAAGNWYRIAFNDGFGWILSSNALVDSACAGLRVFEDTQVEDASLYTGSPADLEAAPEPAAEAAES